MERLQDVLDIFHHRAQFAKLDGLEVGGNSGEGLGTIVRQVHTEFNEATDVFEKVPAQILALESEEFEDLLSTFHAQVACGCACLGGGGLSTGRSWAGPPLYWQVPRPAATLPRDVFERLTTIGGGGGVTPPPPLGPSSHRGGGMKFTKGNVDLGYFRYTNL